MATTSTQVIFDLPVVNGNIIYFRSRAVDLAGNIENWNENVDGDVNAMIAEPYIVYDLIRDDIDDEQVNFSRDYIITTFKPAISSISGISMIISLTWTIGDFAVTLCKGAATEENITEK